MSVFNTYFNPISESSTHLLKPLQTILESATLKSITVFAKYDTKKSMQHSEIFNTDRTPAEEFKKLQTCYQKAIFMLTQTAHANSLEEISIEVVYIAAASSERRVTLTPQGIIFDLSHLE